MTCDVCGRLAPTDPDTGYDADRLCRDCVEDGWIERCDGSIVNEADLCAYCGEADCGPEWEFACPGRRRALAETAAVGEVA